MNLMADENVVEWLSDQERKQFLSRKSVMRMGFDTDSVEIDLTRKLAETRKALAELDHILECEGYRCQLCHGAYHVPTCIIATLPRPR